MVVAGTLLDAHVLVTCARYAEFVDRSDADAVGSVFRPLRREGATA
jgi:hypothetical protein